jgi:hypothetical protein
MAYLFYQKHKIKQEIEFIFIRPEEKGNPRSTPEGGIAIQARL